MTEPLLETPSLQRLQARIALVLGLCWVSAIGALLAVALYEGRTRRSQELESELSMRATLVYGLGWFESTGAYHSEVLDEEPWAHDPEFPVRVLSAGEDPKLLYGPALPADLLTALAPAFEILNGPRAKPWSAEFEGQRLYAIALFADESPQVLGYALVTSDLSALWTERLRYSGGLIGVSLVLALLGIALSLRLAKLSIEPLETLLQGRARFIARAAHELRTPLATLESVAASGLARDEEPERALERVVEISERAASRVDSLLWHARLSSGVPELRREATRIDLLVEGLLDPYPEAQLEAREVTATIDLPLVEVALRNLLENAERHGGASRGRGLRVRVAPYFVELRDAGPGFPEAYRTGDRSPHSKARGGVGLGLEIASEVARLHEGSLTFDSDGDGAWVRLELG